MHGFSTGKARLTAFRFFFIIDGDCSLRLNDKYWLYTSVQGNIGEEEFIWVVFTHHIIVDDDCVGLKGIPNIELHDLTAYSTIVIIWSSCNYMLQYIFLFG